MKKNNIYEFKETYKRVLLVLISFFSIVLIAYMYILFGVNIPTDIKIVLNEEDEFVSSIPITAKFETSSIGVISIDNNVLEKKKLNVSIKDNFLIKGNKTGLYRADVKAFGLISLKNINVEVVEKKKVLVGGNPVGIYVETDGLMVLGTGSVKGMDNVEYNPSKNILKAGDYIVAVNGKKINDKQKFIDYIQKISSKEIRLTLRRNNQIIDVLVNKIKSKDGTYKIGAWIRNNMQGIGTMTFYDKKTGVYGALGHGINDVDTSKLMEVNKGYIYNSRIINIIKGEVNEPGELVGVINHSINYRLGTIKKNTSNGIYGEVDTLGETNIKKRILDDDLIDYLYIGYSHEVKEGKASIRTTLDDKIKEYNVKIVKVVSKDKDNNKNFIIRIVDKELLKATNGIVQGMSGSPIIQNNKIIGALTHVFVNDPTKGYGIFIENML